jgi:hypothetical protein
MGIRGIHAENRGVKPLLYKDVLIVHQRRSVLYRSRQVFFNCSIGIVFSATIRANTLSVTTSLLWLPRRRHERAVRWGYQGLDRVN